LIFLDTGFLYALIDADDAHHARVREVLELQRGRPLSDSVLTTNHVLAETLTLLRKRGKQDSRTRHARAVEVGRQIYAGRFGVFTKSQPRKSAPPSTTSPSTPTTPTASWTVRASW